jgi:hypothetical protein
VRLLRRRILRFVKRSPIALNISIMAAGAAGMYCGSCMRDNGLAATLIRMGHAVTLVPLYTPLRTEALPGERVAHDEVFFGGVNVYLQHASGVFRKTPRASTGCSTATGCSSFVEGKVFRNAACHSRRHS